jgi:hypothetical protein
MKNFSLKDAKILSICLGIYYFLSGLILGFILIVQKLVFQNVPELRQIKETAAFLSMIIDIVNIQLPLIVILGFAFTFLGIFIAKVRYKFYTSLSLMAISLTMMIIFYIKLTAIFTTLQAEIKDFNYLSIGFENFIAPILTFLLPQIILAWGLWTIENRREVADPSAVV